MAHEQFPDAYFHVAMTGSGAKSLSEKGTTVYDISGAAVCRQKTDIQPLLNQGCTKADLALSSFHAIAKQTIGGLVLISIGGMDENTLKSLKKKYFLAPVMLFIMKHGNYEKMKPKLIIAGMSHIRNESKEEIAYTQDMFETIFKDYKQEKDVHISSLLADLMNQKPVTTDDFAQLKGNILLILPDQDFFSGEMQKNLIQLMHNPEIQYVSGGHLSTVLKVDAYVRTIRDFLSKHQGK